jgi:hypothetical protein
MMLLHFLQKHFFVMTLLTVLCFLAQVTPLQLIDGYLNNLSVFPGDSVELYLNASERAEVTLPLLDINGKEVARFQVTVFPQPQPRGRAYENGYAYYLTARVVVPALKSGVYLWANLVPMVIRHPQPKIVVVYPIHTENAYSNAGGKSLYDYNSDQRRATTVSFLRPIPLARHASALYKWLLNHDYQDVGYISDLEMDDYQSMKKASLLIVSGHSEYWTLQGRKNFDRFVNEGKHALVLSGNTMWWQVRYNKDKSKMICYKNPEDDKVRDQKSKTVNWNSPTLGYSILGSIGVDFSFGGYMLKKDNGWDGFKIITDSPLLEGTGLKKGEIVYCSSDEVDGAPILGFDPNQYPVLNKAALGFERAEIIGFDHVSRGGAETLATWIVFKKNKTSGIVINTATTDWCSEYGIGSSEIIQIITKNMIDKLLSGQRVFSPVDQKLPGRSY